MEYEIKSLGFLYKKAKELDFWNIGVSSTSIANCVSKNIRLTTEVKRGFDSHL